MKARDAVPEIGTVMILFITEECQLDEIMHSENWPLKARRAIQIGTAKPTVLCSCLV